jgi:hypothetical protein
MRALLKSLRFILPLLLALLSTRMNAGILINEFLAQNDGGLRDADGDTPDWIELRNDSTNLINLGEWHLTDTATNLTRWTLPATNLPAGGYLVVFASGKDRAVAGGELHASFQLDDQGGYLGLVEPDGVTVAHALAPYPPQRANVSSGPENKVASVLSVDFNDDDSGESGGANTESGFNTMTLSTSPSTFDGMTVSVIPLGITTLDDRDRAVPVASSRITQDQLYDDYVYSTSTANGTGLALALSGLRPERDYYVKIWSVDPGGSTTGARYSDWTETASGASRVIISGYSWDVSVPLADDGHYTFSGSVRSSAAGTLRIEGRRSGGVSTTVCLNAMQLLEAESTSGEASLRYFTPPTPGFNNGSGYLGLVGDTHFSRDRGLYSDPFPVTLSCETTNAQIYWTTNGSVPGPGSGSLYANPIQIPGTTMLRARAFLSNHVPSDVDTHTYLFLSQVLRQAATQPGYPTTWQSSYPADYGMDPNVVNHPNYGTTISNDLRSLPILSIVAPHSDLWGASGIYNNATSLGPQWERAASVELFKPDGGTEFAVNCGIEMHGNASRDNARTPKHSFRLSFKSEYGPSKLRYDWFPGPIQEFDNIVLRSLGFADAWATRYSDTSIVPGTSLRGLRYRPESALYLRDTWIKDSLTDMGSLTTRSTFVHLYLNGLYWGLYNPSERLDAGYFIAHYGGREGDWDVMAGDETYNFAEVRDGNKDDWNELMALVNAGVGSAAAYQAVAELVDLPNLADHMLVHGLAEAEDWPFHNWYAAHRRATNGLPATRWKFFAWDQEICLDRLVRRDRVNVDSADTPSRIYAQLRTNPEFRLLFGDRVQKHLFNGGALTPAANIARWQARADQIDRAIVGESARWGDARETTIGANPGTGQTFTRDEWWVPETQQLYTNLFATLTDTYINLYRAIGLYPATGAPRFSQLGGTVPAEFALSITHTNSFGAIFLTLDGSDPREFGTGAASSQARTYDQPLTFTTATLVRARILRSGQWSALVEASFYPPQDLSKLVLNELMYNPPAMGLTNGEEFEFVELRNVGSETLNLSGLAFTKGIAFTFTNGTLLDPGQYFVLARNAAAFATKYPGVACAGLFTGRLDNAGESITLSHPGGTTVFSLSYADGAPWPAAPDGWGFSLVPVNPGATQAPDAGAKWRASANLAGSPGAEDPDPFLPPIRINEILTHTDPPQFDAVELYNPTATNVNLSSWYLSDDPRQPMKYRIATNTVIAAGGWITFNATQFEPEPGVGNSFAFSSVGDQAWLFSADPAGQLTGYSHGVVFGAAFNGVSFGRYVNEAGEEFFPPQLAVSLDQTNSGPRIGPVVINEIHYHPAPEDDAFVELLNLTPQSLPLFDPAFPTNSWKFNGLTFTFPTNTILPSNGLALVVATDPAAFRAKYNVFTEVPIYGPFTGTLQHDGENLELLAPDAPNVDFSVPFVAVEAVRYNDKAPWPAAADGSGLSLQRRVGAAYGNSPGNWQAAAPTPGRLLSVADSDQDGLPDIWESEHQTDPFTPDAEADPDQDGLTTGQEYVAGTDPQSAQSALRLHAEINSATDVMLRFLAVSNRTYSVLHQPDLASNWFKLTDLPAHPTNRTVVITNQLPHPLRFYRLVTPVQPGEIVE